MERKPSYLQIAYRQNPVKDHPIQDIVYLDQNYKTFKYFLTGKFENDEAKDSDRAHKQKPAFDSNGSQDTFLKQLSTLNEKIKLYTSVFYNKSPKKFSYDSVLANKNLTFNKFKQIKNKSIDSAPQHKRLSSFDYKSEKGEAETSHGLLKSSSIDAGYYDELSVLKASKVDSRNIPEMRSKSLNAGNPSTIKVNNDVRTKLPRTIHVNFNKQAEQQTKPRSLIQAPKLPLRQRKLKTDHSESQLSENHLRSHDSLIKLDPVKVNQ